ncbi:uncharacterized protein LOC112505953 [Cynara cardunculus var. scolymus]|uniref:uncharacterized protein LOC112505953 n=1 Tax=Cynara cardunculus var. scolymus TaxID=59895 RepID=UPI000D62E294|nr:uncharacterized protein LOC112505953 [Cynara cardunculus var. scolymus]
MKTEYHMRLNASVEVCRYLLENVLPSRGNNESEKSIYKGLFLGALKLIGRTNGDIEKVILQNAPKNNQLTYPKIQKDLVTCFVEELLKSIIREIGDDVLALLVDESSDVSRFANLNGIADLARLMVATRKHVSHPLVYRLLKLTLVLSVATATVERCFSAI